MNHTHPSFFSQSPTVIPPTDEPSQACPAEPTGLEALSKLLDQGNRQDSSSVFVQRIPQATDPPKVTDHVVCPATPVQTATFGKPPGSLPLKGRDFIRSYADYADVLETPKEAHALVATSALAAILNREVCIPFGPETLSFDLWVLLLSYSGGGRNTTINLLRPVLKEAGLEDILQSVDWGSGPAVMQQLAENPQGLFLWPEISVVLKTLSDAKFAGVKERITNFYDQRVIPLPFGYRKTGKATDTPTIEFREAPRLNILASSSFDWFTSNLAQGDSTGGFIPRWTLCKLGDRKRSLYKPLPTDTRRIRLLAEHLRRASELRGQADISQGEPLLKAWYETTQNRFESQPNKSLAVAFFNRLRAQVVKFSVIFQVSQDLNLRVLPLAMERAIRLGQRLEQTIFELLPTGMNAEGFETNKLADRIREEGIEGLSHWALTRAFQYLPERERESRLRTLKAARTIVPFARKTQGRRATIYVDADFAEKHAREFPADEQE